MGTLAGPFMAKRCRLLNLEMSMDRVPEELEVLFLRIEIPDTLTMSDMYRQHMRKISAYIRQCIARPWVLKDQDWSSWSEFFVVKDERNWLKSQSIQKVKDDISCRQCQHSLAHETKNPICSTINTASSGTVNHLGPRCLWFTLEYCTCDCVWWLMFMVLSDDCKMLMSLRLHASMDPSCQKGRVQAWIGSIMKLPRQNIFY